VCSLIATREWDEYPCGSLQGSQTGFGDSLVLFSRTAADTKSADYYAVKFQRYPDTYA
jgi:hypothetical protein